MSATLLDISEKTGIHNGYISQLENGKVKNPGLLTCALLANGLGITLDDMAHALLADSKRDDEKWKKLH